MRFLKILSIIIFFITVIAAVSVGNVAIPFFETLKIVFGQTSDITNTAIIRELRLPRVINAVVTGAGLASAGVVMQTLLRNPLAEPYMLGISSGAALGAVIGFVSGSFVMVSVLAFLFAVATVVIVYVLASSKGEINTIRLILTGVIINFFLLGMIVLILTFSTGKIRDLFFWTMGDLGNISYGKLGFFIPIVILVISIFIVMGRDLDMIAMSEEIAFYSGVNTLSIKKIIFILASLMTGILVASNGIIGFVGIIIPHIVKMITGKNHRTLIFFSAIYGAIFLTLCDTIGRSIVTGIEIPVGVITSICGAPVFIYILKKNGDRL